MGLAEACGPNVIEKPTTLGVTEACGLNVIEKPTTLGLAEACGANVIEKPTTLGLAEACGANVIEKPTTLGVTEACGPNVIEKPTTLYVKNSRHCAPNWAAAGGPNVHRSDDQALSSSLKYPSNTCFRVGSKGYSEYEAANLAGVKGRNCDEVQLFG
ncbi:hypothetical protein [Paenibacillus sp. FSL M7-0896]|uniref:hypothetical protein n=1 Tax=Paenibacillus sp. FSL M7-0896 TaxID=2921610 RepID=UPI0030D6DE56